MGQIWGEEVEGRGLEKRAGAVSLTSSIKVMTQRHGIPVSIPSPHPYAHRANMALQRGAQSSVELLQWLAWGLGPPKKSVCPPPCPPHPSQNLIPSPQDLVLQPRGPGLPPLIFPQPNPYHPPWTWGIWTFGPHPWGTQISGTLHVALAETQASDTPIPAQTSEVLVVGGDAHHPRLW